MRIFCCFTKYNVHFVLYCIIFRDLWSICFGVSILSFFPCVASHLALCFIVEKLLHKKWSFLSRIFSVNVTKSAGNCRFRHIYWGNFQWKTSFFVQWIFIIFDDNVSHIVKVSVFYLSIFNSFSYIFQSWFKFYLIFFASDNLWNLHFEWNRCNDNLNFKSQYYCLIFLMYLCYWLGSRLSFSTNVLDLASCFQCFSVVFYLLFFLIFYSFYLFLQTFFKSRISKLSLVRQSILIMM